MSIHVSANDANTFEVTVSSSSTTTHTVTLDDSYYQTLTSGSITKEALVESSFKFLLEREPNTSILGRFDLPVIQQYFSEYERTMKQQFSNRE